MQAINEIGKKYKLFVIEDAAQAHGALIGKQPVGTFGDAAAFSFYPTKNMTSGEGGMIVFKNSENARKARLLRNQGMEIRYQNEIVGFNLRMTDIHAAIGRAQLRRLSEWIDKRQENAEKYSKELKTIGTPYIPNSYTHVFHQYTLTIEKNRDLFSESLKNMGIQSSVYYPKPVHKLPVFAKDYELIETQKACDSVLSIPVHPSLTKKDLKKIIKCINISGQDLL
jgi:dTDP-4-amino-4,6-dideoxygalactose transaminase